MKNRLKTLAVVSVVAGIGTLSYASIHSDKVINDGVATASAVDLSEKSQQIKLPGDLPVPHTDPSIDISNASVYHSDGNVVVQPSASHPVRSSLKNAFSVTGGLPEGRFVSAEKVPLWKLPSNSPVIALSNVQFTVSKDYIPDLASGERRLYVQFSDVLSQPSLQMLKENNVALTEHVTSSAWVVTLNADSVHVLRDLPEFAGLAEVMPIDKASVTLANGQVPVHAKTDSGLKLEAWLYNVHSEQEVVRQLKSFGAKNVEYDNERVSFEVDAENVNSIAGMDDIKSLDFASAPITNSNIDAAKLSSIDTVRANNSLTGQGISVGMWELGTPDIAHQDFLGANGQSRITIKEVGNQSNGSHATHVAGTVLGNGNGDHTATGMAPAASMSSWNTEGNVSSEMTWNAGDINIATHSWGLRSGWEIEDSGDWAYYGNDFGEYNQHSVSFDRAAYSASSLLITKSAGNDRNDIPPNPPENLPSRDGPYFSVLNRAVAKNIMTIGAVDKNGAMSSFSNWGPTADGRIKPDLVADGVGVNSTLPGNQYGGKSGTSMATPVVAGGLALVLERWNQKFQGTPTLVPARSSMIKALATASADDVVDENASPKIYPGPDYQTGWGIFNAEEAVKLIDKGANHFLRIEALEYSGYFQDYLLFVPVQTDVLKVVAAWTEVAANAGTRALINDIDIRLYDPSGNIANVHLPWVLDPGQPDKAASRGNNSTDNIEQILVNNPAPGHWRLRVSRGNWSQWRQEVSIVSTAPFNITDTDGDLISDSDEDRFGTNKYSTDTDQDGLTDLEEVCFDGNCLSYTPYPAGYDSNANMIDTDGDQLDDYTEVMQGRSPVVNEAVLIAIIVSGLL